MKTTHQPPVWQLSKPASRGTKKHLKREARRARRRLPLDADPRVRFRGYL